MRKIVLVMALMAFATPALAETAWVAKLAKPVSQNDIIAGDAIWNCDSSDCHSVSDTSDIDEASACRDLARKFGPLTAFSARQPFSSDKLSKCNQVAAKPAH